MRSLLNPRTGKPIATRGIRALSDDELRALIASHGFADQAKALAICKRESGGFPDVVVDTRGMTAEELLSYWGKKAAPELSVGLFQINVLANGQYDLETLKDPDANMNAAYAMSLGGTSWKAWGG